MATIRKIGLCVVREQRLLVARKHDGLMWILVGGQPEPGETDIEALQRETLEETGVKAVGLRHLLDCQSDAADRPGDQVSVSVYDGALNGNPEPSGEIAELAWLDIHKPQLHVPDTILKHVLPVLRRRDYTRLYHGTCSTRWDQIQANGVLRRAPYGDLCVSLTDDISIARYFAENACSSDDGGSPVILAVDIDGLDAAPHSSPVWGEGECDWERETACWENIPLSRITLIES